MRPGGNSLHLNAPQGCDTLLHQRKATLQRSRRFFRFTYMRFNRALTFAVPHKVHHL